MSQKCIHTQTPATPKESPNAHVPTSRGLCECSISPRGSNKISCRDRLQRAQLAFARLSAKRKCGTPQIQVTANNCSALPTPGGVSRRLLHGSKNGSKVIFLQGLYLFQKQHRRRFPLWNWNKNFFFTSFGTICFRVLFFSHVLALSA